MVKQMTDGNKNFVTEQIELSVVDVAVAEHGRKRQIANLLDG